MKNVPQHFKQYATHQEILVSIKSNFFSSDLCNKTDPLKDNKQSEREKLEEACWNGLVNETLPELLESNHEGKELLLWEIQHGNFFLDLELGDYPFEYVKEFSINPYVFMEVKFLN